MSVGQVNTKGSEIVKDLLWTNPSPTSNFGDTTLSIPTLSNYKSLLLVYKQHKSESADNPKKIIMSSNQRIEFGVAYGETSSTVCRVVRGCNPNIAENKIVIGSDYGAKFTTSSASVVNGPKVYCIPLYIYGIKEDLINL